MADTCSVFTVTALNLLKAGLGYYDSVIPEAVEANLLDLLSVSRQRLRKECDISLIDSDISDAQLLAMYADWLYRSRETGAAKPEMLKDAIRNRQVSTVLIPAEVEA